MFGAHFSRRSLMLPWLIGQGILVLILACLALYYLYLFPAAECSRKSSPDIVFLGGDGGGDNIAYANEEWEPESVDCPVLLWHALVMVLSLLVLVYYIYTVNEFVAQLRLVCFHGKIPNLPVAS